MRRKDKGSRRDKEGALPFADEILVTKAFLEERQNMLQDFERQVRTRAPWHGAVTAGSLQGARWVREANPWVVAEFP